VISTYGGFESSQPAGGAGSVMDAAILINGSTLGNPSQRVSIVPAATLPQGTAAQVQSSSWGFTGSSGIVPPGTYTVDLVARQLSGPPIFVAFPLEPAFNSGAGQLQVLVINR